MNVNQSPISNLQSPITVLKVSGSDLDDATFSKRLAAIIAAQAKAGQRPILVHGGGKEITELLGALKLESKFVDGLRVTDGPTRDVALMVLSGLANKRMVAHVLAAGANAIGLSGVDGGLIGVERLDAALQFVGKPTRVNIQLLNQLTAQHIVPIVAPMSLDAGFEICNVNADHAAGAIAAAMNATMLTFVTNVPGVLDKSKSLISHLSFAETEPLIADGTINGGMIPKVQTCLEALEAGVGRVRITNLDGLVSESGTVFSE
jgi:acetylglutamate kinase